MNPMRGMQGASQGWNSMANSEQRSGEQDYELMRFHAAEAGSAGGTTLSVPALARRDSRGVESRVDIRETMPDPVPFAGGAARGEREYPVLGRVATQSRYRNRLALWGPAASISRLDIDIVIFPSPYSQTVDGTMGISSYYSGSEIPEVVMRSKGPRAFAAPPIPKPDFVLPSAGREAFT